MAVYNLTSDNLKKKKVSATYDLKKVEPEAITFQNDIVNQVKYTEKGNDIVVYGYGTKEVKYQKVVTTYSAEPFATGKNKGKYECAVRTYNATYNGSGVVTGYDEGNCVSQKITYVKNKGANSTVFQILDSKNKVIAKSDVSAVGENKTVADEKNALVTLTFKNATTANIINLQSDLIAQTNLVNTVFDAVKSGNNYKGSWLKERASSTQNNETFALGTNKDTIFYASNSKHGNDTVTLVKDAELTIDVDGENVNQFGFVKKANDVVMTMTKSGGYEGNQYVKNEKTVTKTAGGYEIVDKIYTWNGSSYGTLHYTSDAIPYTTAEFLEIQQSWLEYEGITISEGLNTYYIENYLDTDYSNDIYHEANTSAGTVTFKNYLKLEQDSVKVGAQSLKTILENTQGVGVLNFTGNPKKQTVKGTFLNERITGTALADTISTGKGNDTVYLSAGKDTVTIDGNGQKAFGFVGGANFNGETTVKFAKGLTYGPGGNQTRLDLSAVAGVEGMGYTKSGNDLVVDYSASLVVENRLANLPNGNLNKSKVIIKDYFKDQNIAGGVTISGGKNLAQLQANDDEGDYDLMQIGDENKSNKLADTQYTDYLMGGKKADKFTISHGNTMVVLDKGNDTVTVTKSAVGEVNVYQMKGSGADVLDVSAQANLTGVFIQGDYSDNMVPAQNLSFEKTGDALILKASYAGNVSDSLTIKDYFGDYNADTMFLYGYNPGEDSYYCGDFGETLEASGKRLKINGVKAGKATMYEGTNYDDEYEISIDKKSSIIIGDYRGNDKITVKSDVNNLRLLFDVYENNNGDYVYDSQDLVWIFDSSTFNSKNVQKAYIGDDVTGGAVLWGHDKGWGGYSFYDKNDELIMTDAWIDNIRANVATWLQNNNYESAYSVIEEGSKDDVNALLAIYNTSYEQAVAV